MLTKNKNQGITLIALVVTIVVLLILAGISISMLAGDSGVITQSKNAKESTEQAKVEEYVYVALGGLISKFNGEINGITPKMVADQINENENRSDVYAEDETTFPTNIIFPKENRKAEVKLNVKSADTEDSIYSEDVNEDDIAPVDLFEYEIINDGTTGALNSLTNKTARITKIKPEYCNDYYPSEASGHDSTFYDIIYNGTKLADTLIVPHQVDGKYISNGIEGELYTITEACVYADGGDEYMKGIPNVKKIVYPNTITKITGSSYSNEAIEEIVLPEKIQTIPRNAFKGSSKLKRAMIPKKVINIEFGAFLECTSLTSITIPNSVKVIGEMSFRGCTDLENLIVGDGVTDIENYAFEGCSNLKNVTMGKNITSIEYNAFRGCENLTTINYTGTEEDWNRIEIGIGNDVLKNATINYNYSK